MADPKPALALISEATTHLLATADGFTDADVAKASLLPGWTRGHVLTHLARSGDAARRIAESARTGVPASMYASDEARTAEIEAGARRSAAELAADVRESAGRLAADLAAMPPEAWQTTIKHRRLGDIPASEILHMRLQEVLVHHVDLDADFTPAHWPTPFTAAALDRITAQFTGREDVPGLRLHAEDTDARWTIGGGAVEVRGPQAALLAWLTGRSDGDGLVVDPHGPLPALPAWL